MLDIRFIRENSDKVKENIKKKFQDEKLELVDKVLEADAKYRELLQKEQKLRHEQNTLNLEINKAKKEGKDIRELLEKVKTIPKQIKELEEHTKALKEEIRRYLMLIPNMMHPSVPIGKDDSENVEIERIGEPKKFEFEIINHGELIEKLNIADFETSAEISGKGFYILKSDLALLNMALINYARDYMIKQGYMYVEPPLMIRKRVLDGVYSAKEIEEMAFKVEDEDLYLIATSEHPMIGMFIDKVIDEKYLPIKITGYSMCFRREIGSHGLDEKGLYRTHQFNKQEMIVISKPEDSYKFYDEMLQHTKGIFKGLGLPIRVLEICSGDLSDLKAKSCDVEAWSPRQQKYFEVGSLTNMEEAQARRLNIRVSNGKEKYFPHTLNNTAMATSRALVAILENYQNPDGTITIPEALRPYMYGKSTIKAEPKKWWI
jgi:seryl-tRNA synthetase